MRQNRVRADMIKLALSKRHTRDSFFTEVKNGPTHTSHELLIMDAVAFKKSWANPCIMGYEIKVSRSDFLGDEKWRGYLQYCNQFSFVCPRGMIEPDELPDDIGLIYYNPDKETLYTRRKATHREIDPPLGMMMYLIMRWDGQKHPFFTTEREYFEALRADKKDRKELGRFVAKETQEYIRELVDQIREYKYTKYSYERDMEVMDKLRELVKPFLANPRYQNKWDVLHAVEKILKTGMPPDVAGHVLAMERELDAIKKLVNAEVS